jgi:hypothetical protein
LTPSESFSERVADGVIIAISSPLEPKIITISFSLQRETARESLHSHHESIHCMESINGINAARA